MQFFKAAVFSFLTVSSLVAAAPYPDPDADNMEVEELSRRDAALDAHEDYLVAREEYVEKRDLFRRLGGNGICIAKSAGRKQCEKRVGGKSVYCGQCRPTASRGEYCLCNA